MKLKLGTTVTELKRGADNVTCTLKAKDGKTEQVIVDRVILAMGIVGNVENIGLEAAGIKVDRTHIVAGKYGETGVEGVWAIGDLVGGPWLAHKAMHEGVIVAEKIAGVKGVHPLNTANVAGCTYCWPQVASVGMTEAKAKESGRKIKVGKFPFIGNGKAIALGEADGLIKTVFDAETGELLGAHMIGAEVTELIHHLPASDSVGNDARSGDCGRRRGAAHLTCHPGQQACAAGEARAGIHCARLPDEFRIGAARFPE